MTGQESMTAVRTACSRVAIEILKSYLVRRGPTHEAEIQSFHLLASYYRFLGPTNHFSFRNIHSESRGQETNSEGKRLRIQIIDLSDDRSGT